MTPEERIVAVQSRVLVEAWQEATRRYWERRARTLEAARPRRGDYTGRATAEDLVEQYARLTAAATACRARATLTDLSSRQLLDTLEDLASGAAA